MVHVKNCPYRGGRGNPTWEFDINGKPQIYCLGWIDLMTDEPIELCKNCKDWVHGEQCELDFEEAKKNGFREVKENGKE